MTMNPPPMRSGQSSPTPGPHPEFFLLPPSIKGPAMKPRLLAALCAALLSAGPAAALENTVAPEVRSLERDPQTVMIFGNSYTYYNCGLFDYIWGFSGASGRSKLLAEISTAAGAGLDVHDVCRFLKPAPGGSIDLLFKPVDGRVFDAVILQANSLEPIDPKRSAGFREHAAKQIAAVRGFGAEPLLMITWARKGRPEMTRLLADATIAEANANHAMAVPVGLAFAESQRLNPEIELIMPDKSHPTAAGSYLASAVIWSTLKHESLEGNAFPGGCEKPLSPETAAKLQKTAWEVVRTFFGWKAQ